MTHFSLRILPSEEVKFVVAVSKKVSKKAVVRNRVKRRVRAALRELMEGLTPALYSFSARSGAEEVRGEELRRELAQLLKKS